MMMRSMNRGSKGRRWRRMKEEEEESEEKKEREEGEYTSLDIFLVIAFSFVRKNIQN